MRIKSELLRSITEENVQRLCEPAMFIDGSDLYAAGRVKTLTIHDKAIETEVQEKDGRSCHVVISDFDGDINCECTCSHESFEVCPHVIAVLLCWINVRESMTELRKKKEDKERDEISSYLMNQPKESLVKVIMEQADDSRELLEKLGIESSLRSGTNHDVEIYKQQLDKIFDVDYVGYWKLMDFIANLDMLKKKIDALIDRSLYAQAQAIMLYFLEKAKIMVTKVNDSEGDYVRFVRTLYGSYARILKGLDADPEKVASWIYSEIKTDGYGFADELLEQMKEVLKSEVNKVLENMVWQDFVNCKNPVDKSSGYDMEKQRYKHVLMNIAEVTNNDDLYIKTCEQTLNHGAYEYLVLAKKLESLKRIDEAITRLNDGIDRHPAANVISLQEMLSRLYERQGELRKAFGCAYAVLLKQPSSYHRIKQLAVKLNNWGEVKQECINLMTEGKHLGALTELYLEESRLPEAIAIAKRDDVFAPITWKTAQVAEKDHPHDAIQLYKRFVDYHINLKTKIEYKEAAGVARRIKMLYERLGLAAEWNKYIENLRTKNKRKVNLMKILDKI